VDALSPARHGQTGFAEGEGIGGEICRAVKRLSGLTLEFSTRPAQSGNQIFHHPVGARWPAICPPPRRAARRRNGWFFPISACNAGCASNPAIKPASTSPLPPCARCGLPDGFTKISPSLRPIERLVSLQHHPAIAKALRDFAQGLRTVCLHLLRTVVLSIRAASPGCGVTTRIGSLRQGAAPASPARSRPRPSANSAVAPEAARDVSHVVRQIRRGQAGADQNAAGVSSSILSPASTISPWRPAIATRRRDKHSCVNSVTRPGCARCAARAASTAAP
jgi:hypothetical protein